MESSGSGEITASLESREPQLFAEFDYAGHHFRVLRSAAPASLTKLQVQDETSQGQAEIVGAIETRKMPHKVFFSKPGTVFNVLRFNNLKFDLQDPVASKDPDHVPHLVAETVTQIVSQGKVQEWNSSSNLAPDGGAKMYKYMQSHFADRVKVEQRGASYRVTKR